MCFSCEKIHERKLSRNKETKWMEKFFNDLFLEEGAIFTLWGSKPLTIVPLYLFSDEEMRDLYNQLSEKEKSQVTIIKNYDLPTNWRKWETFQKQLNIKKFALFLRENLENPKIPDIWFVNILETALQIEIHHEIFTRILGFDFETEQVILEIQDPSSIFWNKILSEPLLLGILYGYGKYNAICFHWKHSKNGAIDRSLSFTFSATPKLGCSSIKNFPLPVFASFSNNDPIIEKYKGERREIKKIYNRKNFIPLTLKKLQE